MKITASRNRVTTAGNWRSFIKELEKDLPFSDPLYDETPAGQELQYLCREVENELSVYLDISTKNKNPEIEVYDNASDEFLVGADYQYFNDCVIECALNSKSADAFKAAYKRFLSTFI